MRENKLTLVFPVSGNKVLLGMKKRGFGEGYWNGFGGKVEPIEKAEQTLIRECQEETGITPINYYRVAKLNFFNSRSFEPAHHNFVYVYLCDKWEGEIQETEEMMPKWFSIDSLPFEKMWPPDKIWLPKVLSGDRLKGDVYLNSDGELLEENLIKVAEL